MPHCDHTNPTFRFSHVESTRRNGSCCDMTEKSGLVTPQQRLNASAYFPGPSKNRSSFESSTRKFTSVPGVASRRLSNGRLSLGKDAEDTKGRTGILLTVSYASAVGCQSNVPRIMRRTMSLRTNHSSSAESGSGCILVQSGIRRFIR